MMGTACMLVGYVVVIGVLVHAVVVIGFAAYIAFEFRREWRQP